MHTLTDADSWDTHVSPDPSDSVGSGAMDTVLQPPANRTKWLRNRLKSRLDPSRSTFAITAPAGAIPPAAFTVGHVDTVTLAIGDVVDLAAYVDIKSNDHLLYAYWKVVLPDTTAQYVGGVYRSTDGLLTPGAIFTATQAGSHVFNFTIGGSDGSVALQTGTGKWTKTIVFAVAP